jgi:hypothetical protein
MQPPYDGNLGLEDAIASVAGQDDDQFVTVPGSLWNRRDFNVSGRRLLHKRAGILSCHSQMGHDDEAPAT